MTDDADERRRKARERQRRRRDRLRAGRRVVSVEVDEADLEIALENGGYLDSRSDDPDRVRKALRKLLHDLARHA